MINVSYFRVDANSDMRMVADWHHNARTVASEQFCASFRARFPKPQDDCVHAWMQVRVEMLAAAIERAKSTDAVAVAVAVALEGMKPDARTPGGFHSGAMHATDHQFIQPVHVSLTKPADTPGATHANDGSGHGLCTVRYFEPRPSEKTPTCRMSRP